MTPGSGRTALVTGGSRGIGRAVAERLAADGHNVVVCNRADVAGANDTCGEIRRAGGQAVALKCDVTNSDEVAVLFDTVEDEIGVVEILVNAAGVTRDGLTAMLSDEAWETVIDTNLRGSFFTTRRTVRGLIKSGRRWGRIVHIGSVSATSGLPGQANYGAAKAGLIGLTRVVAREAGPRGITCNLVAPGPIETAMLDQLSESRRAQLRDLVPLRRFGHVNEVAAAVQFLASDDASYISGTVLPIDGGAGMGW